MSITETQVVCRPVNITQDRYANSVHNITVRVCMVCAWVSVGYPCHCKPLPLLLRLQVHLGNQQTIVGLITFQSSFDYLLFVVLPVLATALLCAVLLLVVGCYMSVRKRTCTGGDR